MKLCSACLLGVKCRYSGKSASNQKVIDLSNKEKLIPICPEVFGGQPIPRNPAELCDGTGQDLLDGKAKVIDNKGNDLTEEYIKLAKKTLEFAKKNKITEVIMFTGRGSPSCGCGKIADGTFSNTFITGDGVTTALLKANGIKVISEEDL